MAFALTAALTRVLANSLVHMCGVTGGVSVLLAGTR